MSDDSDRITIDPAMIATASLYRSFAPSGGKLLELLGGRHEHEEVLGDDEDLEREDVRAPCSTLLATDVKRMERLAG